MSRFVIASRPVGAGPPAHRTVRRRRIFAIIPDDMIPNPASPPATDYATDGPLCLAPGVAAQLRGHAAATYPHECCGVLLGPANTAHRLADEVLPAQNIANDPGRAYQIDWRTLFAAVRGTRVGDRRIVGFYHSHPDGTVRPSARDLRDAWPDHVYVIVTVSAGRPADITAWRLHPSGDHFESIRLSGNLGKR